MPDKIIHALRIPLCGAAFTASFLAKSGAHLPRPRPRLAFRDPVAGTYPELSTAEQPEGMIYEICADRAEPINEIPPVPSAMLLSNPVTLPRFGLMMSGRGFRNAPRVMKPISNAESAAAVPTGARLQAECRL